MAHEFDGTKHGKPRDMQAARHAKHPDPARGGTNLTQAAHAAGASKRTGKAWRNGRTRPTGRNERPPADRHRGGMDKPRRTDAEHPCMDERTAIADMHRHGTRRQAPQDPGPHETQWEDPRTDRRHRNVNTNRHHQHRLSTKMLQRPLEFAANAR